MFTYRKTNAHANHIPHSTRALSVGASSGYPYSEHSAIVKLNL